MLQIWRVPSRQELKTLEAVGKPCQKPFDSDVLRILAFSDYRVQDISLLLQFVKSLQPPPNLILYGGDDTERFHNGKDSVWVNPALRERATVTDRLLRRFSIRQNMRNSLHLMSRAPVYRRQSRSQFTSET